MPNGKTDDQRNANLGDINQIYNKIDNMDKNINKRLDKMQEDIEKRIDERIQMHRNKCDASTYYNLSQKEEKKEHRKLIVIIMTLTVAVNGAFQLINLFM